MHLPIIILHKDIALCLRPAVTCMLAADPSGTMSLTLSGPHIKLVGHLRATLGAIVERSDGKSITFNAADYDTVLRVRCVLPVLCLRA